MIKVYEMVQPDAIHVFGTEFPHTLSVINASRKSGRNASTVVSIRGFGIYLCRTLYRKHSRVGAALLHSA